MQESPELGLRLGAKGGGPPDTKTHFEIQFRTVSFCTACLVLFSSLKVYFKNNTFFSLWNSEVSHVCDEITGVLEIYFGSLRLSIKLEAVPEALATLNAALPESGADTAPVPGDT